jgi:hypothetical protein
MKLALYNRPWRPVGLLHVEDPTLPRQSAHRWLGKVVSIIRRPRSTRQKHFYFSASGTHFC